MLPELVEIVPIKFTVLTLLMLGFFAMVTQWFCWLRFRKKPWYPLLLRVRCQWLPSSSLPFLASFELHCHLQGKQKSGCRELLSSGRDLAAQCSPSLIHLIGRYLHRNYCCPWRWEVQPLASELQNLARAKADSQLKMNVQ